MNNYAQKRGKVMNIQMQVSGLIMLICLLYFVLRQKTVGLYTEKVFLRILIISMLCVSFDIISVIAIHFSALLGDGIVKFICKTYIVTLVCVTFSGLYYVFADIYGESYYRKAVLKYNYFAGFSCLLIYLLPIEYVCEGRVVYTQGPSVLVTYIVALALMSVTLYYVTAFRSRMNHRRARAVTFWMLAWFIAALIQFFNNEVLLVGFASCLGMMILFISLENPEANVDRATGCFNSHALLAYIKQCYLRNQQFSALLISLSYTVKNDEEFDYIEQFLKSLSYFLEEKQEIKVFRNVEQELTILADDIKNIQEVVHAIENEFLVAYQKEEEQNIYLLRYLVLEDSQMLRSADEMFPIFEYYKKKDAGLSEQQLLIIDADNIMEYIEKEAIREQISEALQEDRIIVYFQPIYSVKEQKFISAEALVRIVEKDGSIMPPGKFIPVAEETGLIGKLGERVFEKTCAFIQNHKIEELGVSYIEINLSVVQCQNRNLAEKFITIIERYQVSPANIMLEITETASVHAKKILLKNMEILMKYGISFALDDFGNGNSNLDYLIDMPVEILKLDQNMTKAYFNKMKAKYVVDAMKAMVHDMGLKIVAEGVETKEQLEVMEELGIDYIQGYYFSKPLPAEQYLEFLTKQRQECREGQR